MKFLTKAGPAGFLTKQGQVCLDVKFERYQVCWIGWDSPSGKVVCLSLRFRFIQLLPFWFVLKELWHTSNKQLSYFSVACGGACV